MELKLDWLYWTLFWAASAFYLVVLVLFLIRSARRIARRWGSLVKKANDHDGVVAELKQWRKAAGVATARAEDAENRLSTWHIDTLKEGRRRALAEIRARATSTVFSNIEVGLHGSVLVVGARWAGEAPQIDSRFILGSTTLRQPKAVLECEELREKQIALFRVSGVISESYKADLTARARGTGGILTDVEIAPRTDDLEEEILWTES